MDSSIYMINNGSDPNTCYSSLDTSALHFRLAFQKGSMSNDPQMPDDVPATKRDYFPASLPESVNFPAYPLGDTEPERLAAKDIFNVDSEPLPVHLCELLLQTMMDVYSGSQDKAGPQVLQFHPGKHTGTGGRPTVKMLQDMYDLAYKYAKFTTSSLSPRMPKNHVDPITDHSLPQLPPALRPDDSKGAKPNESSELTILDILLALLAWPLWLAEFSIWLATVGPSLLNDLATWPARELIHQILVLPAWSFYMLSRNLLVMEGFISPKPEEIDLGLVVLGMSAKDPLFQLRADLLSPTGFAPVLPTTEPSGLAADRGASMQGFSADPAYPRAMLTDLVPPFETWAPADFPMAPSEYVAPWRYPDHNLAGDRNGWEAPRTHVGPFVQGDSAGVLMGKRPGSDAARAMFEAATTPQETEAASATLMPIAGMHLGDPVDYGVYLMGKLTGNWTSATTYVGHDDGHPLPDFNLDADRGYAYQCWDYVRHDMSAPGSPNAHNPADLIEPDQWNCVPADVTGDPNLQKLVHTLYSYPEPCTVPQRYNAQDNIHHRSRYDPLKCLYHQYLAPGYVQAPSTPSSGCNVDLEVGLDEMVKAMLSPTGRPVP
jgi:hypothetical protein